MQERMRSLVFEKIDDLETVIVDERKQAKTTTTQRNIIYRDFNGLMYIRTLRGKRGKCCLFDCLPEKNIEGSCLNVFNTGRLLQISNNWNDRIKAKIKPITTLLLAPRSLQLVNSFYFLLFCNACDNSFLF